MRIRSLLAVALVATGLTLAPSSPASAVAEPAVPVGTALNMFGHGFGHGRGMSQYGAQGAAIRGVTWSQIIKFYYPGTYLGTTGSRSITVLISADNDTDTIVRPKAGLSIADLGASKVYKLPENGAVAWKLYASNGKFKVSYQKNGWHPYNPGGKTTLVGFGEFRTSSYAVTVKTPGGDVTYRGAIQRRHGHTINRTGLDSYVKGVLATEMPATWRLEALSSQAVAARSYGAYHTVRPRDAVYDICDTTSCQVYGGLSTETTKTSQAVTRTAGRIVLGADTDDPLWPGGGRVAFTEFSSSNGGWSSAGQTREYLVAKADPFEQYSSNPYANWNATVSAATARAKLQALASGKFATDIGTLQSVQVMARSGGGDWGGRVTDIKLIGSKTFVTVGGSDFRTALGLRSTYFQFTS